MKFNRPNIWASVILTSMFYSCSIYCKSNDSITMNNTNPHLIDSSIVNDVKKYFKHIPLSVIQSLFRLSFPVHHREYKTAHEFLPAGYPMRFGQEALTAIVAY